MSKTVILIGTLDTKGEEINLLKTLLQKRGHNVIIADTGILGKPYFQSDITRDEIAIAGGVSIEILKEREDGVFAQKIMGAGLKKIVCSLLKKKGESMVFWL